MGDYLNYKLLIHSWITPEIEKWFKAQALDSTKHFYLYYKKSNECENGKLEISECAPNQSWKLASPERICPSWSKEKAQYRCGDMCWRLPILKP